MRTAAIIAQLIFLEGILSIDNAAVLGALAAVLPARQPVPFPRRLYFLQQPTTRLLGPQRLAALKIGLLMAYLGRALMLLLAQFIRHNVILTIMGALYLVRLAAQHLRGAREASPAADGGDAVSQATFWTIVLQIELVDLTLSLDNVVAAVSVSPQLWVVLTGVGLGILTMRFAAGWFTWLIQREPIIETAAYVIIFNLGLQLLSGALLGLEWPAALKFLVSGTILLLALIYAHLPRRPGWLDAALHALGRYFYLLDRLFVWLLWPLSWLAQRLTGQGAP